MKSVNHWIIIYLFIYKGSTVILSKMAEVVVSKKVLLKVDQAHPFGNIHEYHPAYTIPPQELFDELTKLTPKFMNKVGATIGSHQFVLFHYKSSCEDPKVWNTFWNKYTLNGRSVVFQTDGELKIISPGLVKRFEASIQLDVNDLVAKYHSVPCTATEKMDGQYGSVVILDDDTRVVNSSQTFENDVVQNVITELEKLRAFDKMQKNIVHIFEFVQSQIKCQYDKSRHGLYLITLIRPDGIIYPYDAIAQEAERLGTFVVPIKNFTNIDDVVAWSNSVRDGELTTEGVVVTFADGFGVKVKTPLYYQHVFESMDFTKKDKLAYCVAGIMPNFRSAERREKFIAECDLIIAQFDAKAQPICDFVEANKHLDDKALIKATADAGILPRFLTFIKKRDISQKRMIYKCFVDEV